VDRDSELNSVVDVHLGLIKLGSLELTYPTVVYSFHVGDDSCRSVENTLLQLSVSRLLRSTDHESHVRPPQ